MSGGETTIENGAVIRWDNHKWLESLPKGEREKYNWEIKEYKAFKDLKIAEKELQDFDKSYEQMKKEKEEMVEKCQRKYEEIRKQRKEYRQKNTSQKEEMER